MKRTQRIALSGISGALGLAALAGAAFVPTANAAFWAVAALCLLIPMADNSKTSIIFAVLVFTVISALALLISGNFFELLPFIGFVGPYTVIWYFLNGTKLPMFIKYIIEYVLLFLGIWLTYTLIKELAFEHVQAIDDFVRDKWWLGLIIIAAGLPIFNFALKYGKQLIDQAFNKYRQSK
jgi:hypothetical protein